MMKKVCRVLLTRTLVLAIALSSFFMISGTTIGDGNAEKSKDIVILYTNDVHTHIDGAISYDALAAIKRDLEEDYEYVLLADAGDHIQGTAYGPTDDGKTIVRMMNEAGYDIATLGNHEFDYGMFNCLRLPELAEFAYVSCNFYEEENGIRGGNVLDGYALFECGDETVAFVGITTPETIVSSTPAYFQDADGQYIYGVAGGEDGSALYADIQGAVDSAAEAGATITVALGHLGDEDVRAEWSSRAAIANTAGLDAFIDGHSHSVVKGDLLSDKAGEPVVLTQTGEYFDRIGIMIIDAERDEITTDFIDYKEVLDADDETVIGHELVSSLYRETAIPRDEDLSAIVEKLLADVDAELGQVIGSTPLTLDNYDADGNRLVRVQETNSGDFAADALYYYFDRMGMDVDVAIMNGGGVRNTAITGDITYKSLKEIHPYGNMACLQAISGQQLLDALEWGAKSVGSGEDGGFLHCAGLTYRIDSSIPSTVQADDNGVWAGAPTGAYRVFDVKIYNKDSDSWEALDLSAEYNLAGYNYTLRDLGDGFNMFKGAVNVVDYVLEDYLILAEYVGAYPDAVVQDGSPLQEKYAGLTVDYRDVNGCGRITVK